MMKHIESHIYIMIIYIAQKKIHDHLNWMPRKKNGMECSNAFINSQ